ncbi:hypothetical protein B9Q04_16715 [Candidatus Marsarchaeota G2 archaeon BE_D]|uniref:PIN domain-containing protein n=1 Tax=Candidatus Marsarchaeota G2 archaeon BE_D TaxID=1978158 RepID=A0A2R6C628_9ARCH|nr:MAG: hypothetical protein B9Q04_16715 [Candidatus Marsarchaeota G2 archaeon BE_D]
MKSEDLVFDTGVVFEILIGSAEGEETLQLIEKNRISVYISELNLTELKYIICRKYGEELTEEIIGRLLGSGYFEVSPFPSIADEVWKTKCKYSISLADSATITLGEVLGIKSVFRREKELLAKRLPSHVKFLDEIMNQ